VNALATVHDWHCRDRSILLLAWLRGRRSHIERIASFRQAFRLDDRSRCCTPRGYFPPLVRPFLALAGPPSTWCPDPAPHRHLWGISSSLPLVLLTANLSIPLASFPFSSRASSLGFFGGVQIKISLPPRVWDVCGVGRGLLSLASLRSCPLKGHQGEGLCVALVSLTLVSSISLR